MSILLFASGLLAVIVVRPSHVHAGGTIDSDEQKIVSDIGAWLKVSGEAIYGPGPWRICGEGPSTATQEKDYLDGVKDVPSKPCSAEEFRFTTKGRELYAMLLAWAADGKVTIKLLADDSLNWNEKISNVKLLGSLRTLKWTRNKSGLHITLPQNKPCEIAFAFKFSPQK